MQNRDEQKIKPTTSCTRAWVTCCWRERWLIVMKHMRSEGNRCKCSWCCVSYNHLSFPTPHVLNSEICTNQVNWNWDRNKITKGQNKVFTLFRVTCFCSFIHEWVRPTAHLVKYYFVTSRNNMPQVYFSCSHYSTGNMYGYYSLVPQRTD